MERLEAAAAARRLLEYLSAGLTDAQAVTVAGFFPPWTAGTKYLAGDRVRLGDTLYKCLQSHAAQTDWQPGTAPSLWVRVDDPGAEWPPWRQPQGAEEAYPLGAKVSHGGRRWVSGLDGNVWQPGIHGWEEELSG